MAKRRTSSTRSTRPASRVAVVVSRYNATITDRLLEGAIDAHNSRVGIDPVVIDAPGSFELPALALVAARSGRFDAIVALGCLIKGETSHDRYIAEAVAQGLVNITLITGVPVTFGVLTTDTNEQALARAGGAEGNKGADAMNAALDTLAAIANLESPPSPRLSKPGLSSRLQKPDKLTRSPRR